MAECVKFKADWILIYPDVILGPFENAITPEGFGLVASQIAAAPAPWLALGSDMTTSFVLGETFRVPVSIVTQDGNVVRFRTQLTPAQANGDHQKLSIFLGGTATPGSGIMLNQLRQPFSKASNQILTVECRIYIVSG